MITYNFRKWEKKKPTNRESKENAQEDRQVNESRIKKQKGNDMIEYRVQNC